MILAYVAVVKSTSGVGYSGDTTHISLGKADTVAGKTGNEEKGLKEDN